MTDEHAARRLLGIHAVSNLQGRYMYYLEAHRYDELLDLFARETPAVSAQIGEGGLYVGRAKVETLFLQVLKPFFMLPGLMPLHMLTTPVIEIAADGRRAHGMWQTLGCNAFPQAGGRVAVWQQGYYDNRYVVEGGQWRILSMRWVCNYRTRFDQGWVKEPRYVLDSLDLGILPQELQPNGVGRSEEGYDPTRTRLSGPIPPEPY